MNGSSDEPNEKPIAEYCMPSSTFGLIRKLHEIRHETDTDVDAPGNHDSATNASSTITADDNVSVPFVLSSKEEEVLLDQVTSLAKQSTNPDVSTADSFFLLACLRVRKGDPERALALLANYLQWRRRVNYYRYVRECADPATPSIVKEILDSKLLIVAGNTSRDGRPVVTFRYKYLDPRKFSAEHTARALAIVFEYLLRKCPTAQTHGIVVVDDAAGCSLANLDIGLLRFIARAFSKMLPVRIAAVYIVNPSWIVNIVFHILAPFMSNKLKTRLTLCPSRDPDFFTQFFEPSQIPTFLNLNGSLEWSDAEHAQFVQDVVHHCAAWPPASSHADLQ